MTDVEAKAKRAWVNACFATCLAFALPLAGCSFIEARPVTTRDDAKSVQLYQQAASRGDVPAMVNLGYMYERGMGRLPQDDVEAARLYRLAADQGSPLGRTNLAIMYAGGQGVEHDDTEAVRLLVLASQQDYNKAKLYLAAFYVAGRGGIASNDATAIGCLNFAAEHGEIWALHRIADMYEHGEGGLERNLNMAIQFNERMANKWGSREARAHLSILYEQRRQRDASTEGTLTAP
jgi:TPR repeat protein